MGLNKCRDPRALIRLERATTWASSATDSGRTTSADEYLRFPAQFFMCPAFRWWSISIA